MATRLNSKHEKVSGKSTGKNAPMKKSGYAAGSIHESLIGTKPGLIQGGSNPRPYTGPNVATADRNE